MPAGRSSVASSSARATAAGRRRRAWASSSAPLRPVARATTRNRLRVRLEDLDGLAADAPRRPEQRDAEAPPVSERARRHTGRPRGRRTGTSRCGPGCRRGPGSGVPESLAPAARLSMDSARSPACAVSPRSGPRTRPPSGFWPRPRQHQHRHDRRRDQAADEALDATWTGEMWVRNLWRPTWRPDEVGARVVAPDAEDEQQDPAALGAEGGQRRARRGSRGRSTPTWSTNADQADVDRAEDRREPGDQPVARIAAARRRRRRRARPPRRRAARPCPPSAPTAASSTNATASAVPNSDSDG